jgi:hypothetical protein
MLVCADTFYGLRERQSKKDQSSPDGKNEPHDLDAEMLTGGRQAKPRNDLIPQQEIRIMKRRSAVLALTTLTMTALFSAVIAVPSPSRAEGATQVSGIGYFAAPGQCTDPEGQEASFALTMTGAFSGCHYVFVESTRCSPGGAYFETGTETFVGFYNGEPGTFKTTYVFTATYLDCPNLVGEIAGRCQHPIVDGSGTGIFQGVTGRFDMKDDVEEGNFPYRGHLSF